MKRFISNKAVGVILGIVLFLLVWFILSSVIEDSVMIFPSPLETIGMTFTLLGKAYVYECLGITFLKMLEGFLIGFACGLFFGVLASFVPWLKNVFLPFVTMCKGIPTAALVFFFLVLFHTSGTPVVMVALITFPVIYESFIRGMEQMDAKLIMAARIDGANRMKRFFFIILPDLVPYLLLGVASSFSLSFKIEIMSEILSGDTSSGLGSAILSAQRTNPADMRPIFAYTLIALIFIFAVTLLLHWGEKKIKKSIKS